MVWRAGLCLVSLTDRISQFEYNIDPRIHPFNSLCLITYALMFKRFTMPQFQTKDLIA